MTKKASAGDEARPASRAAAAAYGADLTAPLGRWSEVAARFGLDETAAEAGALLVRTELDDAARADMLGELADKIAPRRRDLIAALAPRVDGPRAAAALAALEARGLVVTFKQYAGPWALAELALDPRVRQHCVQAAAAPPALDPPAPPTERRLRFIPRITKRIQEIARRTATDPTRYLVVVRGRPGSGRDTTLAALLAPLGVAPLARTVAELRQAADPLEPELSGRAAVWDARRWDPTPDDHDLARRWLRRSRTVCVALLDGQQDAPDVEGRLTLSLDLDPVSSAETRGIWEIALRGSGARRRLGSPAAALLGDRNRAGAGLASRAAQLLARSKAHEPLALTHEVEEMLATLVQPSTLRGVLVEHPRVSLAQVVAAPMVLGPLERLMLLCETHARVEAPGGRMGVKALLSGPSGTGKTMAARAIAHRLRRPLHRIDLASVMSRWVGETEKALRDALATAEITGAVLLFDEGDSLFGRRGNVEKGTDRYANMEVSYLLQAIETYAGIAIVTTNQKQEIDQAFDRRFDISIEFTPPGRHERAVIWKQELGAAADGLQPEQLSQLARHADLSGGSIASAARMARVLAAQRGSIMVSNEDLRVALQGEFMKAGMPVQAAQWANTNFETKSAGRAPAPAPGRGAGQPLP
jgi:SpoVK/Ycf46/Vps4 family AAA+-type ATPase